MLCRRITDPFFVRRSIQIGCYSGTTKGGTVIDASWHENDGLTKKTDVRDYYLNMRGMIDAL